MYGEGDRKLSERIKLTEEELQINEITYEDNQHEWEVRVPVGTEDIAKEIKQQILDNQKTVEKINRVKQDTEVLLSDGSENKEELQRVLNLLNYLLDARPSMETEND